MTTDEIVALWHPNRKVDRTDEPGLERALAFADQLRAWIGNEPERLVAIEERSGVHITGWLLDLVSELAMAGRVDDALELCDRFAELSNAEVFLGDRVVILTEAGRQEEAIAAADELLDRFPEHAWSQIFAADAYREMGDETRAETAYLRALELEPTDSHTVEGVLERLVPWLEERGRTGEARRIATRARSGLA